MIAIDKILLSRVIAGDENAFKEIYDRYVVKIYRFVFKFLKNKAEAEDITQKVFIRLWEKRRSIDTEKDFDSFVLTVTHRMVIDHFRLNSTKFLGFVSSEMDATNIVADNRSDDLLLKHQFESLYQKALQTIPARRREVFLLSRHEGLSNKQIAEHLGLSVKTVENHMTAAIFFLKEYFRDAQTGLLLLYVQIFLFPLGVRSFLSVLLK